MPGVIDRFDAEYRFLSNFVRSPIEFEGIVYPGVEWAYQAAKTTDKWIRVSFSREPYPGDVKRVGQRVQCRPDWEEVKITIMENLVRAKFQYPDLRAALLATGDAYLIEGNTWHDNFWGDCRCGRKKCDVEGRNELGLILMRIRDEILQNAPV